MARLTPALDMLAFWPRRSMARALRNPPSPRRYMAMEPSPECASRHGAKGERHFKHRAQANLICIKELTVSSWSSLVVPLFMRWLIRRWSTKSAQVMGVDGEKSAVQVYSHVQELVYLLLSIIIGDGEKLKHQHHCKEAESAEAEA
ncbi:hypothetical protein DY000_02048599 [Brassica cretica]|uniref:Uncharacterized protein n=1 Tax=Brassica cretica TaxID=69181 RepID=A0ABQ7EZF5_BRACR|nr:hypothetical protein DY000_02048599 [Brassica cretica]